MTLERTIAEINEKIQQQKAVVWTVGELKARVADVGITQAAQEVDVITTGSFEPVESTGAMINLGHTDPPIKVRQCWLDGVPAYAGLGAVDIYLGATATAQVEHSKHSETHLPGDLEREIRGNSSIPDRGGGHVIADLIAGQGIRLQATGYATDCYPRTSLEATISRDTINQFYLFNPRTLYQNFIVGVNGGEQLLYTYLGPLQPRLGNAVYSNAGAFSPLLNDPDLEVVGIGTKVFLGGGIGYMSWEGTQHFPRQKRLKNRTPIGPAATVALIGDAKQMSPDWVRGCYFKNYGPSMMLGIGVPFPVLNERVVANCAIADQDIVAPVMDFSIPRRVRPTFGLVTYAQLKSGQIEIEGKKVRTAPLASLYRSAQVAQTLKNWIKAGQFTLTEPVAPIPGDRDFLAQDRWGSKIDLG
ncbi:homocysteine biosynthesis protein [Spirulina sp. CS-785/01]|uniref:homocysteine biosynthesis protein n=1 Tax=Spirulina sp. CS-785/01 TaxID=3021716 RepID=UPI00232B8912|nr:homocysteine biosynthesis protein [Spirulina sp. CS-785/01]MDB9315050.1 homocysteine biosynthesis protein [Spirulina sp. CS-785/01]